MDLKSVPVGDYYPEIVNFIVEIPMGECNIKYEVDKDLGIIKVDRFLSAPMYYPVNYGYIPSTMGLDDDPLDALLLSPWPIYPGVLVCGRPVGVLRMEDEGGQDDKIILLPLGDSYANMQDINHVPQSTKDKISHFFKHYKELDNNKWAKVKDWYGVNIAEQTIIDAVEREKGS